MRKCLGETSVPGVVALLGEYGLGYCEPALAVAIDRQVKVNAQKIDFDFFIVDDYKMDSKKHTIFNCAVERYWSGGPLEFTTTSELPIISGLSTESTLIVAVVGLLTELSSQQASEQNQTNKQYSLTKKLDVIVKQAFALEKSLDDICTPLRTAGATYGGAIYIDTESKGAINSINDESQNTQTKSKSQTLYIHRLSINADFSLIIGYPKQKLDFSKTQPKPLYSKPVKKSATITGFENIPRKLNRLVSRSGLAKDNLKDIGILTQKGRETFKAGNYAKLGELMNKELNLLTMLGLCPQEMRPVIEVAKERSFGVTLTGSAGDTVVAVSDDPEAVVNDIHNTGFNAIMVNVARQGYKVKIEK